MAETEKGKIRQPRTVLIVAGIVLVLAVAAAAALLSRYVRVQPAEGTTVPALVETSAGGNAASELVAGWLPWWGEGPSLSLG